MSHTAWCIPGGEGDPFTCGAALSVASPFALRDPLPKAEEARGAISEVAKLERARGRMATDPRYPRAHLEALSNRSLKALS